MRTRRSVVVAAVLSLVASSLVVGLAPDAAVAGTCPIPGVVSDFNGDGTSDLAIGEPGANRVHVLYGKYGQLQADSPDDQLIGIPSGTQNSSNWYGTTTVTGDFNHDGCGDLAVGDYGGGLTGDVAVYFGSSSGLQTTPHVLTDGHGSDDSGYEFGDSLAVGDLNDDGRDDLIVGETGGNAIFVFLGTASGISTTSHEYAEGVGGVPGGPGGLNGRDDFGFALAVGDFTGDSHADVAISAPYADNSQGRVYVLRGGSTSAPLSTAGAQTWSQDSTGVPGVAETGDLFGWSLAAGDFSGNGRTDLAIGVPNEKLGPVAGAGVVDVLPSSGSGGLIGTGAQQIDQNESGMPEPPQDGGWFGEVLCAADFNGDTDVDLAIGEGDGTVDGQAGAGFVTVVHGTEKGLSADFAQEFAQDSPGVGGTPEANDDFGGQLAAVQVTNVNVFDLVVASPYETVGSGPGYEGMIQLLPGGPGAGLTGAGSEEWYDDSAGVKGDGCYGCWFGLALGARSSTEQV